MTKDNKSKISLKHFKTLNSKSNQIGLDTHELLQVLDRMINSDYDKYWKNKVDKI